MPKPPEYASRASQSDGACEPIGISRSNATIAFTVSNGFARAPIAPSAVEMPLGAVPPAISLGNGAGIPGAFVIAGVAMLALPGPGWVVIFAGMAIWATEFVWAQVVLRWTKRKVTEAAQRALDPAVRRRNIVLTVTGAVIIVVLCTIYLWRFGLVPPWKIKGR